MSRDPGRLVVVVPDAHLLAELAAARLLTHLVDAQSSRRPLHVALTGGTVGIATLAAIATSPVRAAVDWTGVHLWWGDERFLPAGDPERNETQARDALLDGLEELPAQNVHPMPAARPGTPFTVDDAAREYAQELGRHALEGSAVPPFDVVLLGVGPDAHVASLFPGLPGPQVSGRPTVGVRESPKPPPERVSLTFDAINAARQVWVIAAGAGKAEAVAAGLAGFPAPQAPVAGARGREQTVWLLDAAAAAQAADAV
ncbi:MAG: 6-phosphogluconolactonase [Cellulomonadaceae bacterium]